MVIYLVTYSYVHHQPNMCFMNVMLFMRKNDMNLVVITVVFMPSSETVYEKKWPFPVEDQSSNWSMPKLD